MVTPSWIRPRSPRLCGSCGLVAVYEQDPVAAQAGTRTLVFESPSVCVRLSQFPEQWQLLSDDELAALRRSAKSS